MHIYVKLSEELEYRKMFLIIKKKQMFQDFLKRKSLVRVYINLSNKDLLWT